MTSLGDQNLSLACEACLKFWNVFQGDSKAEDQKSFNLSPAERAFLAFKHFMVYHRALLVGLKEQLFLFITV